MILLCFRLVKKPQLLAALHHIGAFLAGLPKPGTLRIEQQFTHALLFSMQLCNLFFERFIFYLQLQKRDGAGLRGRCFPAHCQHHCFLSSYGEIIP